ncbi:MAG: 2-C-methyl-D-erythritol 2,4-cyclodiphosphate synthase, partial [Nitrospiraceae bacterium]
LLSKVTALMKGKGFDIVWVDSTIIAEKPKLAPYIQTMKENIARAGIPEAFMNIKAKTSEGMGFVGNNEGMAAQAVCLLRPLKTLLK